MTPQRIENENGNSLVLFCYNNSRWFRSELKRLCILVSLITICNVGQCGHEIGCQIGILLGRTTLSFNKAFAFILQSLMKQLDYLYSNYQTLDT
jgi:hypothetical protein